MENKFLWEILIPTQDNDGKPFRARYHRVWDAKVREITGGLTILTPARGQWISMTNELFIERMIPVRIYCSEEEINLISDIAAKYYRQKAMMFYCISQKVNIKHYA